MSDSAFKSDQLYPGYHISELKAFVARDGANANPLMVEEIARREAGRSKPFVVPQVKSFTYSSFVNSIK